MTIQFHDRVEKDLESLDGMRKKRVRKQFEVLNCNPFPSGFKHIQCLPGYYRLRAGDDRIIYEVRDGTSIIAMVGHRSHIYEKLQRHV